MLSLFFNRAIASCEVNVMMPLNLFSSYPTINNEETLKSRLSTLASAGTDGIMIDVWWGLVETSEKSYDFSGYKTVFNDIINAGMKIVPVFSFHQCGGNVGDDCSIYIPSFARANSAAFFKDQDGRVDQEYISFAYDNVKITTRTPLEMYYDFMNAFKAEFSNLISNGQISEIEVGVGPCGEARYPSYQLSQGWSYPGCGSFQSYDDQFISQLTTDANAAGHSDWAHNPYNVGSFNVQPGGSTFWTDGQTDSWNSEYGQWFIKWYAAQLNTHAKNVLAKARSVFPSTHLSCKIAGIHWWYMQSTHCAETTAGFNNFYFYDGYRDLVTAFANSNVDVCFTCLEMAEDSSAQSNPPYLVQQLINDAAWAGLKFEGENALEMCGDYTKLSRVVAWVAKGLTSFTLLRLNDNLMNNINWYQQLVQQLHNA